MTTTTARILSRRLLDPRFEPCALERTTTDEITGEDRENMAQWLAEEMTDEIRSLRIHDRLQSSAKESRANDPAV